jgi:hypothetical protein
MLRSVSACDRSIVRPSMAPIAAPVTTNMVIAARTIRLVARLSRPNTESPFPQLRRGPLNEDQHSAHGPITRSSLAQTRLVRPPNQPA